MSPPSPVQISYFSDVLCIWAYAAQIRVDELKKRFGSRIALRYHFIPVFGCTAHRIGEGWRERGGFEGYARHVQGIARGFPHIEVHPELWRAGVPRSSAGCHHFLKSVQLLEADGVIEAGPQDRFDGRSLFEELSWRMRQAFFREARNIAELDCQLQLAEGLGLPGEPILALLHDGAAMGAMCVDADLQHVHRIEGSPTYILNEGRQKLYGNVGYKIVEANVQEVLERPEGQASWC